MRHSPHRPLSSLLITNDNEAFLDQKREKFQEDSQKEKVSKGVEEEMQVCGSVGVRTEQRQKKKLFSH